MKSVIREIFGMPALGTAGAIGGDAMNDILNRLHVQCGSDLHDGFVRSLFSEAAVEIERLRRDAERYRWLRNEAHPDSESGISVGVEKMGDWGKWGTDYQSGSDLDATIDAAMNGANAK